MNTSFTFSAGVWNLNTGADPFGPPVRPERNFVETCRILQQLGFHYVQLHDDDAVPLHVPAHQIPQHCQQIKTICNDHGLGVEFIAPRIWEDPLFADGGPTSNNPQARQRALERAQRAVEIALELDTRRIVLWPAREGTYIREAKNPRTALQRLLDYCNAILQIHPEIRILGEMKPNEPMDLMYLPTTAHMLALCYRTIDPERTGVLIESAHCILLGLDPADEMACALFHNKLWGVHLNDQNGLKYDQDKSFGSVDLRRAFNQVDVLVQNDYGTHGEVVGFDVKAMRTQPHHLATRHLANSKEVFLRLVQLSATIDRQEWQHYIDTQDYDGLDMFILRHFLTT
ncbi:MAG: TIM barrel protein [Chloroherpetonaceae bacterium]|nr:TIM barrel protein [Chthonomonadaceae bacterium]MDW8206943.1 TIM barrel protein [Chloroherpetonaceae bacterium]